MRMRSLNQRSCSSLASGTNTVANNLRNAGRSGWRMEYSTATAPPCEMPIRAKRDRCRLHHRFEVSHLRRQGQVGHVPVREAAATGVVADEPMSAREKAKPVTPHRALPVELEV